MRQSSDARPLRVAFVMEIGLGHTTVYKLFQKVVGEDPRIVPTWIPVEFKPDDFLARVPKVRHDIVLRGGIKGYRQLRAASSGTDFDAVFFHTQMVAIFCTRMMRKIPTLLSIDATPSQFAAMGAHYGLGDPERTSLRERIRERWYREAFTRAASVICMSEWAAEGVQRDYGLPADRTRVFYPGVDLVKWAPGEKSSEGPVRLLFVGGEFTRKGGDLLLRWMNEGGRARCTLDVVTGATVPETPGVTVHKGLGPNDPRLIALYQRADLFVLPTRADAASLVAMEAMASGTPVLSTRMGAIPSWVGEKNGAGVIVEPDQYAPLKEALDALVADRPHLRAMGVRARARAEKLFDGGVNIQRQVAFIRDVASRAKGGVSAAEPGSGAEAAP